VEAGGRAFLLPAAQRVMKCKLDTGFPKVSGSCPATLMAVLFNCQQQRAKVLPRYKLLDTKRSDSCKKFEIEKIQRGWCVRYKDLSLKTS
jgi:hypothetical protein